MYDKINPPVETFSFCFLWCIFFFSRKLSFFSWFITSCFYCFIKFLPPNIELRFKRCFLCRGFLGRGKVTGKGNITERGKRMLSHYVVSKWTFHCIFSDLISTGISDSFLKVMTLILTLKSFKLLNRLGVQGSINLTDVPVGVSQIQRWLWTRLETTVLPMATAQTTVALSDNPKSDSGLWKSVFEFCPSPFFVSNYHFHRLQVTSYKLKCRNN